MESILNFIQALFPYFTDITDLIGGILAGLGTMTVGGFFLFLSIKGFKIMRKHDSDYMLNLMRKMGNKIGLQLYKHALKNVKDKNDRISITAYLDKCGNEFDDGWDLGIKGEKI